MVGIPHFPVNVAESIAHIIEGGDVNSGWTLLVKLAPNFTDIITNVKITAT